MSLERLVSKIVPKSREPILGLELRPFCLGHYFLMQKYNCAFIGEVGGEVGFSDLLIACLICSRTYEEFLEFETLEDNSWLDRTSVWKWLCNRFSFLTYHPLSLRQWCKKWGQEMSKAARGNMPWLLYQCLLETRARDWVKNKNAGNINLIKEFKAFPLYMNEGIEEPAHDIEQDGDGNRAESGTHWTQNLLYVLTKELGYSQSEALNLPISRALADKYKWLEAEGVITINTEADKELFKLQEVNGVNLLGEI